MKAMDNEQTIATTTSNIIVFVDNTPYGEAARAHAQYLATIFKTTVEELHEYNPLFKPNILKEAEEKNTILFVIGVKSKGNSTLFNAQKAISFIKDSRIPTMVVNNQTPLPTDYQRAVLPLDIERYEKEKAMWASYFSRYRIKNGIDSDTDLAVQIFTTPYKDDFLKAKSEGNLNFAKKIYDSLEVDYQLHSLPKNATLYEYALEWANNNSCSPLVIMMTPHLSFADVILGTKEAKIIKAEKNIPILCINQRDDLYVLCT